MFAKSAAHIFLQLALGFSCAAQDESIYRDIDVPVRLVKVQIVDPLERRLEIITTERKPKSIATLDPHQRVHRIKIRVGKYAVRDLDNRDVFALPVFSTSEKDDELEILVGTKKVNNKHWAWIPAGPALIGDELGIGAEDERPLQIKHIEGFWLERTEVTNAQYAEFLNDADRFDAKWIDLESQKCLIQRIGKNNFQVNDSREKFAAKMPVVMVSYFGAQAYCRWLTEKTGTTHRLPTEAEWEKAARGPHSTIYSYGNTYSQSAANQESGYLKPVATFRPNGFGLFDMTGNVFEWMSNKYKPSEKVKSMNQALRGGSFVLDGMYLRNSFRMRQSQSVMTDDIGFRVLREEESVTLTQGDRK